MAEEQAQPAKKVRLTGFAGKVREFPYERLFLIGFLREPDNPRELGGYMTLGRAEDDNIMRIPAVSQTDGAGNAASSYLIRRLQEKTDLACGKDGLSRRANSSGIQGLQFNNELFDQILPTTKGKNQYESNLNALEAIVDYLIENDDSFLSISLAPAKKIEEPSF